MQHDNNNITTAQRLLDGQGLREVSYDAPAYTVIFIAIHWNAESFSFINRLDNRFDIFWQRWKEFKGVLKPMTFHAFEVKAYNTKGGSGQGFTPVRHLMEFDGIHQARSVNKWYLEQYKQWHAHAKPEEVNIQVGRFIEHMVKFGQARKLLNETMMNTLEEIFADDEFIECAAFAIEADKMEWDGVEMPYEELDPFHKELMDTLQWGIDNQSLDELSKDPQLVMMGDIQLEDVRRTNGPIRALTLPAGC